jgi:peptide/nickel transport system substrate-binding protein
MEAYEDYWQGPPKLARVEWRPVLEAATRIVELKTGGADIIDQVPAENIAELEQAGGIQIFRLASEQPECIELNCAREPFNNVKVRQALNYAIDRDSIVQYVMLGAGEPQVTFLSPSHAGTDPDLKPYPYDPDKARSLLEEAGYPNGFKFTLSGPSGRYYKDKEVLEAVGSQLEAIGLTVELNIMEWGAYIGDFVKEPRVYDAGMIGYGDSGTFKSIYTAVYSKSPSYGWYGYTNPDFDTLFDEAMGTFDDNERDLKVRELRQILYDDAPFIYIAAPQILFAARDNVHDFYPWPSGNFWLREGDGCYVS